MPGWNGLVYAVHSGTVPVRSSVGVFPPRNEGCRLPFSEGRYLRSYLPTPTLLSIWEVTSLGSWWRTPSTGSGYCHCQYNRLATLLSPWSRGVRKGVFGCRGPIGTLLVACVGQDVLWTDQDSSSSFWSFQTLYSLGSPRFLYTPDLRYTLGYTLGPCLFPVDPFYSLWT